MTTKGEGIDIPDEQEDKPKESEAESYQGAGRMMVRRSHMAMDNKTVLVGELMLGLVNKYTIFVIFRKTYLLKTMMMRLLEKKVMQMNTGMMKP